MHYVGGTIVLLYGVSVEKNFQYYFRESLFTLLIIFDKYR